MHRPDADFAWRGGSAQHAKGSSKRSYETYPTSAFAPVPSNHAHAFDRARKDHYCTRDEVLHHTYREGTQGCGTGLK